VKPFPSWLRQTFVNSGKVVLYPINDVDTWDQKNIVKGRASKRLGRSDFLHPNYGIPDGAAGVSAGGLMWNGRSASEWGGG